MVICFEEFGKQEGVRNGVRSDRNYRSDFLSAILARARARCGRSLSRLRTACTSEVPSAHHHKCHGVGAALPYW